MLVIEYACLVDGEIALHIAKPTETGANDNQYVLIFERKDNVAAACFVGDWEFESVMHCFERATEYLMAPDEHLSRKFGQTKTKVDEGWELSSLIDATVEIIKTSDKSEHLRRLTIKLPFEAQQPVFWAAKWAGIDDRTFRIYVTDEELRSIGRLFQRFKEATFEPIMTSSITNWFTEPLLSTDSVRQLAYPERVTHAIDHILNECPAGLASHWIKLFDRVHRPVRSRCASCRNYFLVEPADAKWKTRCRGCHFGELPTSFTKDQIEAAGRGEPWLSRVPIAEEPEAEDV